MGATSAGPIAEELMALNSEMRRRGFSAEELRRLCPVKRKRSPRRIAFAIVSLALALGWICRTVPGLGRCLVPNNYLVWEATRPLSDCSFCEGVTAPVVLRGADRASFAPHAYKAGPIVVKGAVRHWRAMDEFDFDAFKRIYERTPGAYESLDDGCQFLHFRSDLFSLREVFAMSDERARHAPGEDPWYVGWVNCHPEVLSKMRQHYSHPDFLPEDAELPNSENVFFGYEQGAVMHLDYIPRLMWQGQIKGNKTWKLAPIPECDAKCEPFQFYVEPGDAVLLDTRIWYHATDIPPGQFSLTIQSEYG